jgi:hypothetical protein
MSSSAAATSARLTGAAREAELEADEVAYFSFPALYAELAA